MSSSKNIQKQILKREHIERKTFSYAFGTCKLEFSLRTDIKQELKDFLVCLEAGAEEVKAELKK